MLQYSNVSIVRCSRVNHPQVSPVYCTVLYTYHPWFRQLLLLQSFEKRAALFKREESRSWRKKNESLLGFFGDVLGNYCKRLRILRFSYLKNREITIQSSIVYLSLQFSFMWIVNEKGANRSWVDARWAFLWILGLSVDQDLLSMLVCYLRNSLLYYKYIRHSFERTSRGPTIGNGKYPIIRDCHILNLNKPDKYT